MDEEKAGKAQEEEEKLAARFKEFEERITEIEDSIPDIATEMAEMVCFKAMKKGGLKRLSSKGESINFDEDSGSAKKSKGNFSTRRRSKA